MSNSPYQDENAVDQKPILNNWNQNEFGLQPRNLVERIAANFIKAFAYNFGFDPTGPIWRAFRSDSSGNLKVSNGAQGITAPLVNSFILSNTQTQIVTINASRRAFMVINDGSGVNVGGTGVVLTYPNPASTNNSYIPVGWTYYDDDWQGTVTAILQTGSGPQTITVIEYY